MHIWKAPVRIAALFLVTTSLSCGTKANLAPTPSEKTIKNIPDWYLETPNEDNAFHAAVSATSKDLQTAITKAQVRGRASLAQQMEARMANLTKDFVEETGVEEGAEILQFFSTTTKAVTDRTLVGSQTVKKQILPEGGVYRAYVLMRLPLDSANKLLLEKLKANEEAYTRFRATEAFEELNMELED